jgi:tRNA(adenine34) deaminase
MSLNPFNNEYFMKKAYEEACIAFEEGEVPVGVVVVCNNQIIGRGHNQVEKMNDVTSHAEIIALTAASNYLGSKYLEDCRIYVTLEPCVMCAAAISFAHIPQVIIGTKDPKRGFSLYKPNIFPAKTKIVFGIMQDLCNEILINFFKPKRI